MGSNGPRPTSADVLVVGSGGGALAAACRAADRGARVVVAERRRSSVGSTAVSGGVVWAPNNHLMAHAGYPDSAEQSAEYLRTAVSAIDASSIDWIVETIPRAVRYLVDELDVALQPIPRPDYHQELPGAARGGRSLDNLPLDIRALPGLESLLRKPSYYQPITLMERDEWPGTQADLKALIEQRKAAGIRTAGGALVGRMLLAALRRGVTLLPRARARELVMENSRVVGAVIETDGAHVRFMARDVVLAAGGFEWDPRLQEAFFDAPAVPVTPPHNTGDAVLMGIRAGAAVSHLPSSWGVPVIVPTGYTYDGVPSARIANTELTRPGSLMVNSSGRRFTNESGNYFDLARGFAHRSTVDSRLLNQPAWLVFDDRYRRSYPVVGCEPDSPNPDWIVPAESLAVLANRCGIDAEQLESTVERFNEHAAEGRDPDFHRGADHHDQYLGDRTRTGAARNLAPLSEPPFYAVQIHAGTVGTVGGLLTDDSGRVVDNGHKPIAGLHAAGNSSFGLFGVAYPGAGATIASGIVRGYAIGESLTFA